MAKGVIVCLCMIILFGLLVEDSNARSISNGAVRKGASPPCGPSHGKSCVNAPPANNNDRGCEKQEECRHSPPKDD
ncbi:hypothetical protein FH972_015206 [Carpinus fangiana]|uniref:Rapid ALkalinization Factor n=1 Tax=Carpinus fangiana TaxID=176857 RepID=A0A5N6RDW0_9ROSI|nr:hypothetical protein FH972_015206 [Carpinus fangiana]